MCYSCVDVTGRATLGEFIALEYVHRFSAYLMGGYSVVLASLILIAIGENRRHNKDGQQQSFPIWIGGHFMSP